MVLIMFVAFHEVSVYPKKELPFFILFTAGLCSVTALLAIMTHRYPDKMTEIVRAVSNYLCLLRLTSSLMYNCIIL